MTLSYSNNTLQLLSHKFATDMSGYFMSSKTCTFHACIGSVWRIGRTDVAVELMVFPSGWVIRSGVVLFVILDCGALGGK